MKIILNKALSKIILFFLLSTIVLIVISCTGSGNKIKQHTIVCYIDYSETQDWPERMNTMKAVIKNSLINKLSYNTQLVILPIDKSSSNASKEIIIENVADEFDFIPDGTASIDEEKVAANNLQKLRTDITTRFEKSFDKTASERIGLKQGTDIFGALQQAKRYFNLTKGGKFSIILLSDMMNWSPSLKMEEANFNVSNINKALQNAPVCDLKGVNVLVFTGETNYIDAGHYELVKKFWEKYFNREQLTLIDYSSGALSSLEKFISTP